MRGQIDSFRGFNRLCLVYSFMLVMVVGCTDDSDVSADDAGIEQPEDANGPRDVDGEDIEASPDATHTSGDGDTAGRSDVSDGEVGHGDVSGGDVSDDDVSDDDVSDAASPAQGCPSSGSGFSVTRVDGDLEDGAELSVCGVGFGAQGPEAVFFDNFEAGGAGDQLTESSSVRGTWTRPRGHTVDDASRSGDLSLLVSDANEYRLASAAVGFPDDDGDFGLMHFDQFFVSWAERDMGDFPGDNSSPTTFSTDSSVKDIWVMYGDRGDNYDYSCSQGECNGNDIVLATHTGGGGFKTDGNNTRSNWWMGDFWEFQAWNMMSVYLAIDSQDPYGDIDAGVFEHFSAGKSMHREEYNGHMLRDLDEVPPVFDRVVVGAWYRDLGDVRRIMDDVYVSVGEGAPARVEIANAEHIQDATRIAISLVDQWSDHRVDVTLNLGGLDPAQQDLYLFVVDADNQRSGGYSLSDRPE